MRSIQLLSVVVSLFLLLPVLSACSDKSASGSATPVGKAPINEPPAAEKAETAPAPAATCEHGVKSALCARCNPRLESVFRAKNDWCPEHARPESQCVLCSPGLAQQGVK